MDVKVKKLYKLAFQFTFATIIIALAEGLVSTYFGYQDESLTLFGFGVGSYIEVISGISVVHMIFRIRRYPDSHRDRFERTALHITGFGFYILVVGLIATSIYNVYTKHKPNTTISGVFIALISIVLMWILMYGKN